MENTKDKKYILFINIFMQLVFCFYSVFFNVYIFELSQGLNLSLLCSLVGMLFAYVLDAIITRFITKKFLNIAFKMSFVLCLVATLLTFLISSSSLFLAFIVQIIYSTASYFYYMATEVAMMNKNSKGQMKKFLGLKNSLSVFSAVLSPFLSGILIDFASYYILFGAMIVCVVICFLFSAKLTLSANEIEHISIKEYFKISHSDKAVRFGYYGYSLSRFSQSGVLDAILPVLLFIRTGTNYNVGFYSAIAALVASVALLIYSSFAKNKKYGLWISTVLQVVASMLILMLDSIVIFFIYYFVKQITIKLICNDINSSLFTLVNHTSLRKYKVEQHFAYHTYNTFTRTISCVLSLILYNFVDSVLGISIFLAITALMQVVSTFFMTKSDEMLKDTVPYEEPQLMKN